MVKPKILIWDIETSKSIVTTFSLFPNFISHKAIRQDWFIISAAWKWLGESKIHSISILDNKKDLFDDTAVTRKLRELTEEADIIVHHNGDKFDLKKLHTRIIKHGIEPFHRKPLTIDTLKQARKHFSFTSNRLDYLGIFLGVGKKVPTEDDLWEKVLDGDRKAIARMVHYNKGDVKLQEAVFKRLAPYIDHPGFISDDRPRCQNVNCRSIHLVKNLLRYTAGGIPKQQYRCRDCGSYTTDKHRVKRG
jgi:DNA polymerase elongation subunit (family B)